MNRMARAEASPGRTRTVEDVTATSVVEFQALRPKPAAPVPTRTLLSKVT
jgi:hypothetical protein